MAPTASIHDIASRLSPRQSSRCPDNTFYRAGYCYTSWDYYGRWIFMGVVVGICILVFFIWGCINSRRRRRNGMQPMYGTGWMARPPYNPQHSNVNNPAGYNNAPPAYGAPPGQSYPMNPQQQGNFQPSNGYYGQYEGVQAPKNVYQNQHNDDYAPPPGPPPPANRP
jgi:hypothetical protein